MEKMMMLLFAINMIIAFVGMRFSLIHLTIILVTERWRKK